MSNIDPLIKAATDFLQEHLNDYGHGSVDRWEEIEEELGWGEDCAAVRLGRALTAYKKESK